MIDKIVYTKDGKVKCPKCGSTQIYHEVSVMAKIMVNTNKVCDVDKNNTDNIFDPYYCKRCDWSNIDVMLKRR